MGKGLKIILRIGIIGLVTVFVLFVGFVGFSVWLNSSNNQEKGVKEEIIKTDKTDSKKALLVYQPSKTKAASDIAHQIAKGLNECGYEVVMEYPGKKLSKEVSQYSILIFGSPTYTGRISTVLTDYMKKIGNFSGKKVIIYAEGAMKDSKELDLLEKPLGGVKPFIKQKLLSSDKTGAYELGKAAAKE